MYLNRDPHRQPKSQTFARAVVFAPLAQPMPFAPSPFAVLTTGATHA